VDKLTSEALGEVLCFGLQDQKVRFRRIKSVIRHPLDEKLFRVRTSYGRRVRVTSSHSVFVYDNGKLKLKRGDELRLNDRVVAPFRIRFPSAAPERIDLLRFACSAAGFQADLGSRPSRGRLVQGRRPQQACAATRI
jgi:DNA gyrase subunit B